MGKSACRVGILHQNVRGGDAIGHDIFGMYHLLTAMGFDTAIVGDYIDEKTLSAKKVREDIHKVSPREFDLLIYHHSTLWEEGEAFARRFAGPILFRYHNVTPAHFFAPYSALYTKLCGEGRRQTGRLVALFPERSVWLAASEYNRAELLAHDPIGQPERFCTAPPFHTIAGVSHSAFRIPHSSFIHLLFAGRFAPNKGHLALLSTIHAFVTQIHPQIKLTLVGMQDPQLKGYVNQIKKQVQALRLESHVEILNHVPQEQLASLFASSGVYLCQSEHEGFCVPIIEAQAAGIPVISTNAAALAETAGQGQLIADPPRSAADFYFYARLIQEACGNMDLRKQLIQDGHANIARRFRPEIIENQFMAALWPLLERHVA